MSIGAPHLQHVFQRTGIETRHDRRIHDRQAALTGQKPCNAPIGPGFYGNRERNSLNAPALTPWRFHKRPRSVND